MSAQMPCHKHTFSSIQILVILGTVLPISEYVTIRLPATHFTDDDDEVPVFAGQYRLMESGMGTEL